MSILKRRDSKGFVMFHAFLGPDAKIERIYKPDHYGQDLFPRETVEHYMLIRLAAELWQIGPEDLNPREFFSLLPFGKAYVIQILDATGRVHSDRL